MQSQISFYLHSVCVNRFDSILLYFSLVVFIIVKRLNTKHLLAVDTSPIHCWLIPFSWIEFHSECHLLLNRKWLTERNLVQLNFDEIQTIVQWIILIANTFRNIRMCNRYKLLKVRTEFLFRFEASSPSSLCLSAFFGQSSFFSN